MGYRKAPTIYLLSFADPEYEGLEVRLKGVRLGKIRELFGLTQKGDMSVEEMDKLLGIVEENLVSWNLEECDDDGEPVLDDNGDPIPVPCNKEGLNAQEVQFVLDIVDTWLDGMTGVSEDLGKDSGSGETFPVALPEMETL